MRFINSKPHPTVTDHGIFGFFQEYRFLSNFHLCKVVYDGYVYASSEHCYMAQKTNDPVEKYQLSTSGNLTTVEAKKFGQTVKLIDGWDDIRCVVMREVVLAKFRQNRELANKLLLTGDQYLEETNYWGDRFWGSHVARNQTRLYFPHDERETYGENNLGSILMDVRKQLKLESLRV